jgi:hypothetical protein
VDTATAFVALHRPLHRSHSILQGARTRSVGLVGGAFGGLCVVTLVEKKFESCRGQGEEELRWVCESLFFFLTHCHCSISYLCSHILYVLSKLDSTSHSSLFSHVCKHYRQIAPSSLCLTQACDERPLHPVQLRYRPNIKPTHIVTFVLRRTRNPQPCLCKSPSHTCLGIRYSLFRRTCR